MSLDVERRAYHQSSGVQTPEVGEDLINQNVCLPFRGRVIAYADPILAKSEDRALQTGVPRLPEPPVGPRSGGDEDDRRRNRAAVAGRAAQTAVFQRSADG